MPPPTAPHKRSSSTSSGSSSNSCISPSTNKHVTFNDSQEGRKKIEHLLDLRFFNDTINCLLVTFLALSEFHMKFMKSFDLFVFFPVIECSGSNSPNGDKAPKSESKKSSNPPEGPEDLSQKDEEKPKASKDTKTEAQNNQKRKCNEEDQESQTKKQKVDEVNEEKQK